MVILLVDIRAVYIAAVATLKSENIRQVVSRYLTPPPVTKKWEHIQRPLVETPPKEAL